MRKYLFSGAPSLLSKPSEEETVMQLWQDLEQGAAVFRLERDAPQVRRPKVQITTCYCSRRNDILYVEYGLNNKYKVKIIS